MTPEHREDIEHATDRFWDEIAQGGAGDPAGVDAADMIAIRYLHSHIAFPDPAAAFVTRLRAELMRAHALPVSSEPRPPVLPNGRVLQQPRTFSNPTARVSNLRRWRYLPLAAAILLLLAGAYLVFRMDGGGKEPSIPAVIAPASTPAPSVTPSPVATNNATLVEIDLPVGSLPRDAYGSTLDQRTMPPSSRITTQVAGGLQVNYVVSGHVSIRSDGPMRQFRGADGSWQAIEPGTLVALDPGDAYFLDGDSPITLINVSVEPVEFIAWSMTAGGGGNSEAPDGWTVQDNAAIHMAAIDRPDGPTRVQLRRVELLPGDDLTSPSGALLYQTVFLDVNAAGETVAPVLGQLPDGGKRNAGRQPITIYEFVIEPRNAAHETDATGSPTT